MSDYSFNPELACKIGVDEAIMFNNIVYWIRYNKANEKNFYEGRYWTYNSIKAFVELMPFWTAKQIRRVLDSLCDKKVIIKGVFNKENFDRTGWYALTDEYDSHLVILDLPKRDNSFAQMGNTIPCNKHTYSKHKEEAASQASLEFEENLNSPKQPKKIKKEKKEGIAIFLVCRRFWLEEFHPGWTFSGAAGKSLYELIAKLKEKLKTSNPEFTDDDVGDLFKTICRLLPEWYRSKDLQTLNSKFNELFEEIKSGLNGTKRITRGESKYRT